MSAKKVGMGVFGAVFLCGMLCIVPNAFANATQNSQASVDQSHNRRQVRPIRRTQAPGQVDRRQALKGIAAATGGLLVPRGGHETIASDVQKTEQTGTTSPALSLVDRALHQEVTGNNKERARLLGLARTKEPDSNRVNWHGGKVKAGNEWISYGDFPKQVAQENPKLAEYWTRRAKAFENVRIKGLDPDRVHLGLAEFCQQEGLRTQAQAHWVQVLASDPNNGRARRYLGFVKRSGVWVTPEQVAFAKAETARAQKNLGRWKSEMTAFRAKWFSNNEGQRNEAKQTMEKFHDPSCIPAIEQVLAMHSPAAAQLAAELLAAIEGQEAAVALTRLAVLSPSDQVSVTVASKLKSRDRFLYVEPLLGLMASPIRTEVESFYDRKGRSILRQITVQEGHRVTDVSVVDTRVSQEWKKNYASSLKTASRKMARRGMREWVKNQEIAAINNRIMDVLSTATGEDAQSPEEWWAWWRTENEVYTPDYGIYKRVRTRHRIEHFELSCLAADTPVITDAGKKAIQDVRIGDCVLSQHPFTGELGYQPVLQTTVRPPEQLIQFSTGHEKGISAEITCSGGHPFWVAGEGWAKARDLKPGNHLHCVSGVTSVSDVGEGPKKETYNLVVGGTHNYFVGAPLMLSHDNTIHGSTRDLIVPGLAKQR